MDLKNVYLFTGAAPDDLDALGAIVERKLHTLGDLIYRQGDDADALFVINIGSVEILQGDKETVFATIGSGQTFGELAFFEHGKRPASASVRERTELLRIPYEGLSKVLADRPGLALLVYRNACRFFARHFRTIAVDLNRRYF
jgi:NTE family protein